MKQWNNPKHFHSVNTMPKRSMYYYCTAENKSGWLKFDIFENSFIEHGEWFDTPLMGSIRCNELTHWNNCGVSSLNSVENHKRLPRKIKKKLGEKK